MLVCGIIFKQCGYGGIGRRVWFRSICSQGHAGSSPVIRTIEKARFIELFSFAYLFAYVVTMQTFSHKLW